MEVAPRKFTPHEYQELAISFLLATPRAALFAGMGMGKTSGTLSVIDSLLLTGTDDPFLVIGPLRVARDTWPNEVHKWQDFRHLEIVPVTGAPAERRAALRRPAHVYTTNYEQLPWLVEHFEKRPWPFRNIVCDESPRLKGFRTKQGGIRTRALSTVARQTDRWINLTGTPAANGLKDLWGQFWFLDFGQRLGRTFTAFQERWFRQNYNGYGIKPMPYAEREIHAAIEDITFSIRPEDWFNLEDPIEEVIPITLPTRVRKQYDELELEMFTQLECGTEVEVFNAAALTNKCRQLANGAVYTDYPSWAAVHDLKIEVLDSIVEESAGASVLVAYEFKSDRARILQHFGKRAVDLSTPAGLAEFQRGEVTVGLAHPASMGHGIDGLQDVCNILVYFGHGWDLEQRQQILERIGPVRQMQSGHKRPVWVYSIVAEDTLDETVLERHKSKRAVQDLLLAAMTRRRGA